MDLSIYIPSYIYDQIVTNQQPSIMFKKLESFPLPDFDSLEFFRNKVAFNSKIQSLAIHKYIDLDVTKYSNIETYMVNDIYDIRDVLVDIFKTTLGFDLIMSADQIANILFRNYANLKCCIIPYKIDKHNHTLTFVNLKIKTSSSCICSIEHQKKLIVEYIIYQYTFI